MTEEVNSFHEALALLKAEKKRKFVQTVDLIVNLHNYDVRKEALNTFLTVPHPTEKRICAFLQKPSSIVPTITEEGFKKYKTKKEMKNLSNEYDFFIAVAPMMSKIATHFGRVLGPTGQMPSPQAGIMPNDNEETIKAMIEKMKKSIRIRNKEASIKIPVGKEDMDEKSLAENIEEILKQLETKLPKGKENIKDVLVKFTMTKPIKFVNNNKK